MFIDEVKMELHGGKGGDGVVSYRHELKVEKGGPFGGSGGKGGDIYFVGDEGLSTLLDLKFKKVLKALSGERGQTKGMTGANAENTYIHVPLGTTVYDDDTNLVIADITENKKEYLICRGGRGGRGNMAFATGYNRCPDFSEKGEPGQIRYIRCSLKVLADCGLVGFPSVGKSTIISVLSNAKPKIASYHFTTLVPHLGVVDALDGKSFVMADLPGIIEGAHLGYGLGLEFLKHIERCKVIVHVIDMAATEGRDPYNDYVVISNELKDYKMNLSKRPVIIVANKMDMPGAKENLEAFKKKVNLDVIPISAIKKENLNELVYKISHLLEVTPSFSLFEENEFSDETVYSLKENRPLYNIIREDEHTFRVEGDGLYRIYQMTDFNVEAAIIRFARQLRFLGLDDKLREMGAVDGDTVKIYDYQFEYIG